MLLKLWLKRAAKALLAVTLLVMAAWSLSRWLGPTDAQEAALAMMREPLPPVQRNAFPALWLMPYDIPEAKRDDVFAEDVKRLKAMPFTRSEDTAETVGAAGYVSVAAARYPTPVMSVDDSTLFCRGHESCLAKVRADAPAYAALVARHAALLDRIDALSGHDGLRHSFGLRMDMPFPPYQFGNLARTRHALWFVQGRKAEAFDGVCRAITTWRSIGANSDNLISRMMGDFYSGHTYPHLFAEMLAETPRHFALPPSCAAAFSTPAGAEFSVCQAMRGEFAYQDSGMLAIGSGAFGEPTWWPDVMLPLIFDREMTAADAAETLGYYCSAEFERGMREDVRMPRPELSLGLTRFQCLSNPLGCMLGETAAPAFEGYAGRLQDSNANLRLIGVLLRLRGDASDTRLFAVRLQSAAGEIGSASREVSLTADGRSIRMRNYQKSIGEYREIPLPAYFQDNAAASR